MTRLTERTNQAYLAFVDTWGDACLDRSQHEDILRELVAAEKKLPGYLAFFQQKMAQGQIHGTAALLSTAEHAASWFAIPVDRARPCGCFGGWQVVFRGMSEWTAHAILEDYRLSVTADDTELTAIERLLYDYVSVGNTPEDTPALAYLDQCIGAVLAAGKEKEEA